MTMELCHTGMLTVTKHFIRDTFAPTSTVYKMLLFTSNIKKGERNDDLNDFD